jgi:hypothetical protein
VAIQARTMVRLSFVLASVLSCVENIVCASRGRAVTHPNCAPPPFYYEVVAADSAQLLQHISEGGARLRVEVGVGIACKESARVEKEGALVAA